MTFTWPFETAHLVDESNPADNSSAQASANSRPANLTTVDFANDIESDRANRQDRVELVTLAEAVKDATVMNDYVATCQDQRILEFTHVPDGYTQEMAEEFANQPDTVRWAILADGRFVGNIEVRLIDPQARAVDVGYMTAPWGRGKGIATRALKMVLRYCFDQGVHRVEGKAAVHNAASRYVMEQAGMRFEGVARGAEYLRGHFNDLAVYAKLSTD